MDYYLHDRKEPGETEHRTSSDRVEWTSMRNLATGRTDVATAIMISTAKDANRLKQQAGVKAAGRKAKTPVKTFALSWHPDEAASLDRAEMERAANQALKTIGMEKHQAIIVCHNDTRHPHVHVVVNRVNPENGKLAKCGPNENRALDRWAYEYERDRGNIVSPNRAAKHERQDRLRQRHSTDERRDYVRRMHVQREDGSRTKNLRQRSTEQRARHKQEWADLSARYQSEKRNLRDAWRAKFRDARREFNKQHRGLWKQYGRDKWRRRREFEKLDRTFYGRFSLSIQAAQMQRASGERDFKKTGLARLTWINLRNPELRNATIGALEKQDLEAFKRWHDRPFQPKLKKLQQARSQDYRDAYSRFQADRSDLFARQQTERSELQSMWRGNRNENGGPARRIKGPADREDTRALVALRAGMQGNPMTNQAHVAEFTKGASARTERSSETLHGGSSVQSKAKDSLSAMRTRSHRTHERRSEERER
ncbi:relaxase/mobilization nuclease domain-containing protein [Roseobacter sp. A03A-229]